jgi:plastocyanin
MDRLLVTLVVLLLVGFGVIFLLSSSDLGVSGNNVFSEEKSFGQVKTFIMTGENFKFVVDGVDNPDIRVKHGDTIRIEFDWVVDDFDAATEKVRDSDESTFVEFVVDKKGNFEYYCSVGQHRENGMKGNLIVE